MASKLDLHHGPILMLVTVGVLAAIVYGAAAVTVGRPIVVGDSFAYNKAAMRLLNTGVFQYTGDDISSASPDAFTVPGYAVFLAAIYAFLPHSGDAVANMLGAQIPIMLAQLLLALATALLICYAGYRLGGQCVGWVSGAFAAAYLPFGMNATIALTETAALFLMSAVVLSTVELFRSRVASERHDLIWAIVLGVSGGVSTLVRPSIALWLLLAMASWLWIRRASALREWKTMGVAAACVLLVMLPWVARNAIAFGEFIPLTSSASTPLLDSVGGANFTAAEELIAARAEASGDDPYSAVAMSRLAAFWKRSPVAFTKWKATVLWEGVSGFTNLPADVVDHIQLSGTLAQGSFADPGRFSPLEDLAFFARVSAWLTIYHRLLLLLAIIGVSLGRHRKVIWLLASIPAYYAAVHLAILFKVRYFYPAMPAVVLLAAFGTAGCLRIAVAAVVSGNARSTRVEVD